ncbi:MAG: D-alanyl-D-alanine carboxypeptidase family protein [Longicatena sp.]
MKKVFLICLSFCLSCSLIGIHAEESELAQSAKGAYLMEYMSGKVIYKKNETDKLYPASMTKMMGLLLIFEGLHQHKITMHDNVTTSSFAASMGGSQVFLEPNEVMSVEDMLKAICIASANDAMVAMGEKLEGTNDHFVKKMNEKAKELKLEKTNFTNATGLHDPNHYSCAKDMALLARALLQVGGDELLKFTSTYDAYIREDSESKFWLVNTNKLLKQYEGVDGLKTGFTAEALSCISVSAKRDNLRLIAVVMGEPTSKQRNEEIKQMLDYGFSQYAQGLLYGQGTKFKSIDVENGKPNQAKIIALKDAVYIFKKGEEPKEKNKEYVITKKNPPYKAKEAIGYLKITMSDNYSMEVPIGLDTNVDTLTYFDILKKTIREVFV